MICRILGAGMVAIEVSTSSCVSRRAETCTQESMSNQHLAKVAEHEAVTHPQDASFAAVDQHRAIDGLAETVSRLDQREACHLVAVLVDVVRDCAGSLSTLAPPQTVSPRNDSPFCELRETISTAALHPSASSTSSPKPSTAPVPRCEPISGRSSGGASRRGGEEIACKVGERLAFCRTWGESIATEERRLAA